MDLRRLKCFIAVAEELHFGRAAERVHLSQPAVSLQIRSLEEELGVQLFSRTNRRVSLTHAGAVFFEEAHALLEHTEAVLNSVRELDCEGPGKLIIGSTPPAIYCLAPAIINALRTYLPDTEVRISPLSTEEQEQALLDGKIHAGLVHPPMSCKTISLLPLGSARIVLALSARHLLAEHKALSFSLLRDEKLIMFPRTVGPWLYDRILGACLKEGFTARINQEAAPAQTIIGLVAAEQGIGLVIETCQQLAPDGVVFRPIEGEPIKLDFAIAIAPGAPRRLAEAIRSMIVDVDFQHHLSMLALNRNDSHLESGEIGERAK